MFSDEVSDDFSFTEPRIDPAQSETLSFFILIELILIDHHGVVVFVIDTDLKSIGLELLLDRGKMLLIRDWDLFVVDFWGCSLQDFCFTYVFLACKCVFHFDFLPEARDGFRVANRRIVGKLRLGVLSISIEIASCIFFSWYVMGRVVSLRLIMAGAWSADPAALSRRLIPESARSNITLIIIFRWLTDLTWTRIEYAMSCR